ncbi:MAG TPA: cytochrome c biogenesis protein ResB [Terriglobales bacterium]|nr:cytochrome c biogenesis protein ResB [Terriglobales bacterium]
MASKSILNKILRSLSSIKTGVFLLILVVIASAIGTFVLQRPTTDADQIERTYSPATLQWLDRLGFTDVFHSWWFATMLALVAVCIILVSIDRFPRAWKVLTRPYKQTDSHFRAVLPVQEKIPVTNADNAVSVAERAFRKTGLKAQRVGAAKETSLFAERNRYSVLAVYIVHASLLLIFLGGIVDALYGYKGFLMMKKGAAVNEVQLSDKRIHKLPFTLRFDTGRREDYPDGSPKQWWSQVTVLQDGKEIQKKKIEVNDPLVRDGIRFFQASFGNTEDLDSLVVTAAEKKNPANVKELSLKGNEPAQLDADTTVALVNFIPDYVVRDNQIYKRSNDAVNPAIELAVTKKGETQTVWLFPQQPDPNAASTSDFAFEYKSAALAPFTGLQVSHEPGQWAVWAGCVLMGVGLAMAFYCVHRRYWAAVVNDPKLGLTLWIGMQADKNREHYTDEFKELTDHMRAELQIEASVTPEERSLASV